MTFCCQSNLIYKCAQASALKGSKDTSAILDAIEPQIAAILDAIEEPEQKDADEKKQRKLRVAAVKQGTDWASAELQGISSLLGGGLISNNRRGVVLARKALLEILVQAKNEFRVRNEL